MGVAISIQSLIFVAEPFYNEPGDEDSMGTEWGDQQSRAYNVVIQSGTTKYAMIEMLENPPAAWKDVIDTHFTLQGDRALKNVTDWLGAEHKVKANRVFLRGFGFATEYWSINVRRKLFLFGGDFLIFSPKYSSWNLFPMFNPKRSGSLIFRSFSTQCGFDF